MMCKMRLQPSMVIWNFFFGAGVWMIFINWLFALTNRAWYTIWQSICICVEPWRLCLHTFQFYFWMQPIQSCKRVNICLKWTIHKCIIYDLIVDYSKNIHSTFHLKHILLYSQLVVGDDDYDVHEKCVYWALVAFFWFISVSLKICRVILVKWMRTFIGRDFTFSFYCHQCPHPCQQKCVESFSSFFSIRFRNMINF